MAIEFKYKGTVWRADTAKEAVALRTELEKSTVPSVVEHDLMERMDRMYEFWTPDKFMDVIEGIGELQNRLLLTVRQKPRIGSAELVQALGLGSEVALAGVISGLSKKLKQLSIDLKQVLAVEVKWSGRVKTRKFILDDFFSAIGDEQGWPDDWPKKGKHVVEDSRTTQKKTRHLGGL
jgi:hypothetical protein